MARAGRGIYLRHDPTGGTMDAFTPRDRELLRRRGLDEAKARADLEPFRRGQRYVELARACGPGDGLAALDPDEQDDLIREYSQAAAAGRAMQFVPASGAA